jgi:tetratricopeptide (TPR) repeat protein
VTNEGSFMSDKYRPTYLILLAVLSAMTLPVCSFGQTTAEDFANRAMAKHIAGDSNGAIADYTKAVELNPKLTYVYVNRGIAKIKSDLDGAIADFTKAIELNPKFTAAYYDRGSAKANKGDLEGAIADCTKAIELDPKNPIAYLYRGHAKEKGDLNGAIADYTKVIELKPELAAAYLYRSAAKKKNGDQVGADEDFAQAAKLKVSHP